MNHLDKVREDKDLLCGLMNRMLNDRMDQLGVLLRPPNFKVFWTGTCVPMPRWCRLINRAMFRICRKWYKK